MNDIITTIKEAIEKMKTRGASEVESQVTIAIKTDTGETILRTVIVPGRAISISPVNLNTAYGVEAKKDIEL